MRIALVVVAAATTLVVSPVYAKGCIRGAAAGGVAGHMVGKGHGVAGAAAGCAMSHHHYAKKAAKQK